VDNSKDMEIKMDEIDEAASRGSDESVKKRAEVLREELKKAHRINEIEEKINDLQRELFSISDLIKRLNEKEANLSNLEEELKKYEDLKKLIDQSGGNIDNKIAAYKKILKDRETMYTSFQEEIDRLKSELQRYEGAGFKKNRYFLVSASLTIIFFITGIVMYFLMPDIFLIFPVASLFGLLFTGVIIWKELGRKNRWMEISLSLKKKERAFNESNSKIEFEIAKMQAILKKYNLNLPDEIKESIEEYNNIYKEFERLKKEIEDDRLKNKDENITIRENEIKVEIEKLTEELKNMGGTSMDIQEIQRELNEIEKNLKDGGNKTPIKQEVKMQSEILKDEMDVLDLLEVSRMFFKEDIYNFLPKILAYVSNYLPKLSGQRYATISLKDNIIYAISSDGETIDYKKLNSSGRLSIYISVKLAVLRYIIDTRNLPFLFDDIERGLDDERKKALGGILKELSENTQGIVLSSSSIFNSFALNKIQI